MNIDEIRDKNGKFPAYTWPGGYPMFYMDNNGCGMCPACANKYEEDFLWDDPIKAYSVNWEDSDLYCDDCGERIESAYAEV